VTMLIGYARVATVDQTLALQQDALAKAGCEKIFTDTASGIKTERPGLAEALSFARRGDTLVVWRLDRLGRSLRHLIDTVTTLKEGSIHFRILQEQIDTATSGGKLVFHLFGALAEFERGLIRERTQAGLARRDVVVLQTARDVEIPVVIPIAGGYGRDPETTVSIHAETARLAAEFAADLVDLVDHHHRVVGPGVAALG